MIKMYTSINTPESTGVIEERVIRTFAEVGKSSELLVTEQDSVIEVTQPISCLKIICSDTGLGNVPRIKIQGDDIEMLEYFEYNNSDKVYQNMIIYSNVAIIYRLINPSSNLVSRMIGIADQYGYSLILGTVLISYPCDEELSIHGLGNGHDIDLSGIKNIDQISLGEQVSNGAIILRNGVIRSSLIVDDFDEDFKPLHTVFNFINMKIGFLGLMSTEMGESVPNCLTLNRDKNTTVSYFNPYEIQFNSI